MIAVSKGSRADILESYPALDPDRVRVVLNGIDSEEYRPDPRTDVLELTCEMSRVALPMPGAKPTKAELAIDPSPFKARVEPPSICVALV